MNNNWKQNIDQILELEHLRETTTEIEYIRMKMTMRVCIISVFFGLSFSIILFALGLSFEGTVCLCQPLCYALVAYLVFLGKFEIAKIAHAITANWGIFAFASYCGYDSGVHLYVLLGPTFVLSIYDLSRKKEIAFSLLLYIATFFLFLKYSLNPLFPKIPEYILSAQVAMFLYSVNIIFVIILSTILMAYVLNLNTDFIFEILRKNKSLNAKETSLQTEIENRKTSENRLRRMYAELQVSFERINHFSQMVSHNMRSPIANLKGIMHLVNDETVLPEEKEIYLAAIAESVNKLDSVIIDMNDILSAQKDVNEKRIYVDFQIELNSILATEMHFLTITNTKIVSNFEAIKGAVSIKSFVHSILQNLISNAVKYKKLDMAPLITITSYIENENVFLKVEDNGLGIDLTKNKDKIFKPYKRFHTHVEGKGLGLYLVFTQAQMLGGEVKIESELGKGTSFIVNLGRVEKFEDKDNLKDIVEND